ncbi:leucine-rich repeat-containing protein 42 isoform X2 [Ranitomeya imitator]|uniref:leucine-rich repeat-containing protein 42 isoform X2 n=1 Tax=Ranitomeya imitator TaxID=111125 RepID=UPI0037E74373
MSQFSDFRGNEDLGPVFVREKGQLFLAGSHCARINTSPVRLFSKGFSVQLCVNQGDHCKPKEKPFIFTYTEQGSLRYSAKPLFTMALDLIADNIRHVDSLLGFPEQVAERLFTAAEARLQFCHPQNGLVALRKFTEAYGDLMLSSLCLRGKYLLVSEKLEEIKSFHGLRSLDLSCCKLGDGHELFGHLCTEAMDSLRALYLKDNCLSDTGVRKLTAPVRVLHRGLGKLTLLDVSCNPEITETGVSFLLVFNQLEYLDISDTGVQLFCQWDQLVSSSIKPNKITQSRTAAQQFYGKEKVNCEDLPTPVRYENPTNGTKHLQFHRPAVVKNPIQTVPNSGHFPVKRTKEEKRVGDTKSSHPAKKSRVALTSEDWDLLNSY